MSTSFPITKDSFTNPASSDKTNSPAHATQHADANDAIEAIEEELIDNRTIASHAYASSVALDRNDGMIHTITAITGNLTLTASNMTAGKIMIIKLVWGDSTTHTVTFPGTVTWADGNAPALTCTNAATDAFLLICTGTDTYDGYLLDAYKGQWIRSVISLSTADISVGTGKDEFTIPATVVAGKWVIETVEVEVDTAPGTDKTLTIDVNKAGTTILSAGISVTGTAVLSTGNTPSVTALSAGDRMTLDIDTATSGLSTGRVRTNLVVKQYIQTA